MRTYVPPIHLGATRNVGYGWAHHSSWRNCMVNSVSVSIMGPNCKGSANTTKLHQMASAYKTSSATGSSPDGRKTAYQA